MKASYTFLAAVAAATTMAFSSASPSSSNGDLNLALSPPSRQGFVSDSASEKEKFAPRLDGLRFIETLVTAHR